MVFSLAFNGTRSRVTDKVTVLTELVHGMIF